MIQTIQNAIDHLRDSKTKKILKAYYTGENKTPKDISAELAITLNLVNVNLHRSKYLLHSIINAKYPELQYYDLPN